MTSHEDSEAGAEGIEHPMPVWTGPPSGVRGGQADLRLEIGRSDSTVVLVDDVRAFPEGAVLRLTVAIRPTTVARRSAVYTSLDVAHGRGSLPARLAPGGLRWGLTFSDGRSARSTDASPWSELPDGTSPAEWLPPTPFLDGLARPSIYAETWTRDVWLWPLPPPGPVIVTCSWPDRGIVETAQELDGDVLREASRRAEALWR